MTENSFPGPMSMVKIDGTKIKRLREQQGLTQLYLATAVEVTTDTISRWENKRYPSIKRENGLKLAEALGVSLEEILDIEDKQDTLQPDETVPPPPPLEDLQLKPSSKRKKIWPILVLSATLFSIIFAFSFYYLKIKDEKYLEAVRIMPSHGISGQPIPVVIKISEASGEPTAMILTEMIPSNSEVANIYPDSTRKEAKKNQIKWLGKVSGTAVYSYIIKSNSNNNKHILFNGKTSIVNKDEAVIKGETQILLGSYHWADENRDNVISDKEILAVYDKYSEVKGIENEIDTVEEIWLGSGYRWVQDTGSYEIIE